MSAPTAPRHPGVGRRLLRAATWLTTPLLPGDYLGFVNPLWSTAELRGRVVQVRREAAESATVVVRPSRDWAGHLAGQFVRLGVEVDGVRHHRTYSLTSIPDAADGCFSVTVKAVAGGTVSAQLVHRTAPGDVVRLEQAAGAFVLPEACPERLLFITAGSGITPVMGMLRTLDRTGEQPDVVVVHTARTPEDVIFGPELRLLARRGALRLHEHHTARHGRPTPAGIAALVGDWERREAFACGPGALLDALEAHFAGAGAGERLRVERFRAPVADGAVGDGGRITFMRSGRVVHADGATSLLDAGEGAGALLPSGCRMGICHTCVGRLRSGRVCDLRTGDVRDSPGEMIQTCVSAASGPVEIDL